MATIVTRAGKGSALSHNEVDANFTNLNSDKLEANSNITVADATVTGDLTVQGTTTTLNTATLQVEDKNITLNYSTGDSSGSADGAGITIQDAVSSSTDATILWDATNDTFDFSHALQVQGLVDIASGEIGLKNSGSVSNIKFYCEVSNAHYTALQSSPHSAYSGNVTLTLPPATDTLVGRATTDTLTNKTLTSPVLSGNVGINIASPADELHINATSANVNMRLTRDTDTGARISGSDGAGTPVIKFDTIASGTATERARIDASGRLGVNVTDPDEKLEVGGDVKIGQSGDSGVLHFGNTSDQTKIIGRGSSHATLADTMDFYTDETIRVRLDNSGNVGIGTQNPGRLLDVENSSGAAFVSVVSSTSDTAGLLLGDTDTDHRGRVEYDNANDALKLYTASSTRVTIDSAGDATFTGDVSAGASATGGITAYAINYIGDDLLNVFGSLRSSGRTVLTYGVKPSPTTNGGYVSAADNFSFSKAAIEIGGGALFFKTSAGATDTVGDPVTMTSRFSIDVSGNGVFTGSVTASSFIGAGIGASASSMMATGDVYAGVNNESYVRFQGSTGTKYARFYLEGDEDVRFTEGGTITANGNVVAYSTSIASDAKLKDNVETLEGCLDKVCQMRGVSYTWNDQSSKDGVEDIGVIAQEMAEIYPEVVTEADGLNGKDPHLTVDYARLTAVLINAVKELRAEVKELKNAPSV